MENKFNKLTTDFKSCEIPHDYYPRPQMKRESFILLNGEWDFAEKKDRKTLKYDEKIIVPFPMESQLSGIGRIHNKSKTMFYKREFEIKLSEKYPFVLLNFGAVDCITNVYINGKFVDKNIGGYLPFTLDITEFVKDGKNIIEVEVKDELLYIYPYGKQKYKRGGMWYTVVSGIWQSVWIEQVAEDYIESIKIDTTLNDITLNIVGGKEKKVFIFDGKEYEFEGNKFNFEIENPILWSPENPHLYNFSIKSGDDTIESYFGLREIKVDTDEMGVQRIFLNGKPYFFTGLLDQGYFPDGIYMPNSIEGFEFDLNTIKKMGFNMLRKHIKVEPDIYYYLCDKMGICIFQDMVNNGKYSFLYDTILPTVWKKENNDKNKHKNKLEREVFKMSTRHTIRHLYNHPSIVYYTIFNEGWGQFCSDEMYELVKSEDNTRIIDSTSGWFRNNISDVLSEHIYFKPIKLSPSPKPIILSEFGGYSYKIKEHSYNNQKTYGYKFFKDKDEYMESLEELYLDQVLPYIEIGLCATIYTQTSDVEDETNGLITYDRKIIKVDIDKMLAINEKLKANNK